MISAADVAEAPLPHATDVGKIEVAEEKKPAGPRTAKKPGKATVKGSSDFETMSAIKELGGATASMLADRLKLTEAGVFARLTKLKIEDLVAATGKRPNKWRLTGKGLDAWSMEEAKQNGIEEEK